MKVLLIEARAKASLLPVAKLLLSHIRQYKSVCLVTTVQHIHKLKEVKEFLESSEKKVYIGKPGEHCVYAGQILGCDAGAANTPAEAIVFFGTGEFHPLAINKPILLANPYSKEIREFDSSKEQNKRIMAAEKVKAAKKIGILVSTKPGQYRMKEAEALKKKLEKQGKRAYIFIGDMLMPSELMNFPDIEAWINTACPRLIEDDFGKPIANWKDF